MQFKISKLSFKGEVLWPISVEKEPMKDLKCSMTPGLLHQAEKESGTFWSRTWNQVAYVQYKTTCRNENSEHFDSVTKHTKSMDFRNSPIFSAFIPREIAQ